MKILSIGDFKYFVVFIDDYFPKIWIYFIQSKNKTFGKF